MKRAPAGLVLALAALMAGAARANDRGFRITSFYHVGFWVRDIAPVRAFYHDYLGFAEPYDLNSPQGALTMVAMKVAERQVVYLFPNPAKIRPNGDNFNHLGLETDNAEALRTHLIAHGVKVGGPHLGRIKDLILLLKDPDGHAYEITQFEPEGQILKHQGVGLEPGRISQHLRSATVSVADVGRAVRFYTEILGFKTISDHPRRLRLPDGDDFIELVTGPTRAVPEYTLAVDSAAAAEQILRQRAASGNFPAPSAVAPGTDGKPTVRVQDPDGTTVVLSE